MRLADRDERSEPPVGRSEPPVERHGRNADEYVGTYFHPNLVRYSMEHLDNMDCEHVE